MIIDWQTIGPDGQGIYSMSGEGLLYDNSARLFQFRTKQSFFKVVVNQTVEQSFVNAAGGAKTVIPGCTPHFVIKEGTCCKSVVENRKRKIVI